MNVVPSAELKAILADLVAGTTGAWDLAKVKLFKTDLNLNGDMVLADFTANEADFDGYAAGSAITWPAVFINEDGSAEVIGPNQQFLMNGATTPNTIYGYWVEDAGGTKVLWAEKLDTPKTMDEADDAITIAPRFTLS